MLGATALKVLKLGTGFTTYQWGLIFLGAFLSYLVAEVVIKTFMKFIKNNSFTVFGIYRIIIGIVVLGYIYL